MRYRTSVMTLIAVFLLCQFVSAQRRGVGVRVRDAGGQTREITLYEGSYALVIGNSRYDGGWDELPGVTSDITAVRDVLERHGFKVKTAENLSSRQFDEHVREFIESYGFQRHNRLLIYFAGHGYTLTSAGDERELGYIVPTDAPSPARDELGFLRKAISMDAIQTFAKRIQAKHALFIFDSCFSGKLVSRNAVTVPPFIQESVAYPVREFITAGAANQTVPDASIFRQVLVRGLEGEADRNNDGYVTGTELADYLKEKVTNYTERKQTPQFGKINDVALDRGEFVFVVPKGMPPPVSGVARSDYRRWLTLLGGQDYAAVTREVTAELARAPRNVLALRARAGIHIAGNEVAKGRRDATEIELLLANPNTSEEYEARCYARVTLGKNDEAVSDCTRAVELDPRFAVAYFDRGIAYQVKGEIDRAFSDLTKAIELDPHYKWAYNNRASVYLAKTEYDRAIADFTKVIELSPKHATAYANRGHTLVNKGEYDRAFPDFDKAIELDPKGAATYQLRGMAYGAKGSNDGVIADFSRVIELDPKNVAAYTRRGYAYHNKRDYARALADFNKVVELDPKFVEGYNGRGSVYSDQKEYERAFADFNEAIRLNPQLANAYYNRASTHYDKGEYERAIANYTVVIELAGKSATAYNDRGNAYSSNQEYDRAIADYTKAIELIPSDAVIYHNRGGAYHDKGDYDRAIADYGLAIQLNPKFAQAYKDRADAYEAKGDWARGAADRRKAAALERQGP